MQTQGEKNPLSRDLWNTYARSVLNVPWFREDAEAVIKWYGTKKGEALARVLDEWLNVHIRTLDKYRHLPDVVEYHLSDDVEIACILMKKSKQDILVMAVRTKLLAIFESEIST